MWARMLTHVLVAIAVLEAGGQTFSLADTSDVLNSGGHQQFEGAAMSREDVALH